MGIVGRSINTRAWRPARTRPSSLDPCGSRELDGLDDLAGAEAAGANPDVFARGANQDVHSVQVGPLDALGLDVRVADSVGNLSLLAANFTLRWHGFSEGG
jgi:hypothetical protein